MTGPAAVGDDSPQPIVPETPAALSPYIRRVVADNPGPMTGPGTNTYLIGVDEIVVVDPGPESAAHLDAVVGAGSGRIRWIVLTHTHEDHYPGTAALKEATGAQVCAFDDRADVPLDRALADDDVIDASEFRVRVVHTPGHASNHLCYFLEEERTLFSGDHIMDGSTVVIAPPDGDMAAYMESLRRVRAIKRLKAIAPGHGHLITDPIAAIDAYLDHRSEREAQILAELSTGDPMAIETIVERLYPGLIEDLVPRAAQSVHAHLIKLMGEGRASGTDAESPWKLTA